MLKPLSIIALALTVLPGVAGAQQAVDSYGRPAVTSPPSQAMGPADTGGTFRDEYGNLYNSRGDRIDRSGRILPPPVTPPGARALP